MSVNAVVRQVEAALVHAHALFGDPPSSGAAAAAGAGDQSGGGGHLVGSGPRRIAGLSGQFATDYRGFADHTGPALHRLAGNDHRLGGQLQQAADVDRTGRAQSGAVIEAAVADTAALAPLANTQAGEKALLGALRARMVEQYRRDRERARRPDRRTATRAHPPTDDPPAVKHQEPGHLPPPTTPPDAVNKWWDALSEHQRDQLIAQHPPQLSPQEFVDVVLAAVRSAGKVNRVEIESFDWRALPMVHQAEPSIPGVALWNEKTWVPGSPWLAGIDPAAVGDPIIGAMMVGANVVSPGYSVPYGQTPNDPGFTLVADKSFVDRAHALGVRVIPWTINDAGTMRAQIAAGADGIITDYPALLRAVMTELAMPLPPAYHHR